MKDGKYRLKFLAEIANSPKLPSELASKFNISRVSVSRILKDLKEMGLIESFQSNSRTILYSITDEGKRALREVKNVR
ncbi:MAG: MarR family transcriptional regulator [Thermodesulfobium sp.]